jgi:aminopeptidase N
MKDGQPKAIELSEYQVPPYLISTTELHVDLNEDESLVTSTLAFTKNPESKSGSTDLVLNGSANLDTRVIKIDGRELLSNEYNIDGDFLTLFGAPTSFSLETIVAVKPQENTALEGLYKSGDMFCTQCEAEGFRNITWYMDRPDVMSKYTTTIQADKSLYPILLSNGNEIGRGDAGDKHWVTWQDPFNKPAYLFAMVAGDLQYIEDHYTTMSGRNVTLQIFTESHNIDKVDFAMIALKSSMAWDEKTYGREYDLDIFMIVAVESFNMGAMENKGLNIFNTSCVLARPDTTTDAGYQRVEAVVAHEYFHNWSGNRVTCRDWFQLSLKEGFTVLRDQQFSADMGSETVCRVTDVATLRNAQFPEDAGPMSHPIRPSSYIEINNFYTATVYEKGAEVVRMIRTLLSEQKFRKGTDLYFDRHDGAAVTTEDFVRAMEDANDADLSQFRYWYSQAGTPILDANGAYDSNTNTYRLTVKQSCPTTPGQDSKQPFHMPIAIGLLGATGQDVEFEASSEDVANVVTDGQYTAVLNLRQAEQQFDLTNVTEKPVISLLRGFSAPVKLNFDYSRDELQFLMQHDSDGFNRWEAGQRLALGVIQNVVAQIQQGLPIEVDPRLVSAVEGLLDEAVNHSSDGSIDKAMIADMLVMPSEAYLAELTEVADVDAIHQAREAVRLQLTTKLKGLFLSVYRLNQSSVSYSFGSEEVARRALKNVCLAYLMHGPETEAVALCVAQFESADNMTDTSAAIRALVNCPADAAVLPREKALTEFYKRWAKEALVIDQWFGMQASCLLPSALERLKSLMQHHAFTMKNPNRMRSVVVSFASQNIVNFHQKDGSGYEFLADRVIELNDINPQMAARVLSPLTRWHKYDLDRQVLMKSQLQRILDQEALSPDVFEIASKSV